MKNRRVHVVFITLLTAAIACAGCIHVATKAGQPPRNATPLEKALVYNDSLAQANRGIATAVINANQTVPPLIPMDAANRILTQQSRIADFDRQLTPLLQDSANLQANAAKIGQLLDEIKAAGNVIIKFDLGIKNAAKQKEVLDAFNNVYNLADAIVTALGTAGVLK